MLVLLFWTTSLCFDSNVEVADSNIAVIFPCVLFFCIFAPRIFQWNYKVLLLNLRVTMSIKLHNNKKK
jgi:hypothetical protein